MKNKTNKFNVVKTYNETADIYEELEGFQIIENEWDKNGICKRCGKPFIKKYEKQKFCNQECNNKYHMKVKALFGNMSKFKKWLDDEIDYRYSPEKF